MIIGIYGNLGSGKTCFMIYLMKKYFEKGYKIYTNLKRIRKIEVHEFKPLDFYINPPQRSEKILVALDEIYLWLDCRRSGSWQNLILSYLILQSRKYKFDLIFTEQLRYLADLRLYEFTDVWVRCEKMNEKYSLLEVRDYREFPKITVKRFLFDRRPIYEMYDTYEIVRPIMLDAKTVKKALKDLQKS